MRSRDGAAVTCGEMLWFDVRACVTMSWSLSAGRVFEDMRAQAHIFLMH